MKKERRPKQFVQKPTYEGGPKAMIAFISQSLKYPKEALKSKIEGTVRLRIRINYKGVVEKTNIIAGLGHGCDEEAQRVAELLQFKVPVNRGIRAHFHKTLNFHFRLPKTKTEEEQIQGLQYTIVSDNNKQDKEDGSSPNTGYGYQINF